MPKLDGALRLFGSNYVTVDTSTDINRGLFPERTVALWFYADDAGSPQKQVLYDQGGKTRGLNIYLDEGDLYVGGWNTVETGWSGTFLSDAVTSDDWHHVALVLDGGATVEAGAFRAYLDGSEMVPGGGVGSQLYAHGPLAMGALRGSTKFHDGDASGTGTAGFSGLLDDVQAYNRSLDDTEVAVLASATPVDPLLISSAIKLHRVEAVSSARSSPRESTFASLESLADEWGDSSAQMARQTAGDRTTMVADIAFADTSFSPLRTRLRIVAMGDDDDAQPFEQA